MKLFSRVGGKLRPVRFNILIESGADCVGHNFVIVLYHRNLGAGKGRMTFNGRQAELQDYKEVIHLLDSQFAAKEVRFTFVDLIGRLWHSRWRRGCNRLVLGCCGKRQGYQGDYYYCVFNHMLSNKGNRVNSLNLWLPELKTCSSISYPTKSNPILWATILDD